MTTKKVEEGLTIKERCCLYVQNVISYEPPSKDARARKLKKGTERKRKKNSQNTKGSKNAKNRKKGYQGKSRENKSKFGKKDQRSAMKPNATRKRKQRKKAES